MYQPRGGAYTTTTVNLMALPHRTRRSFESDDTHTVTLPDGQRAHADHAAQSRVLERSFYEVRPGVWCLVGNGLSNQTFIEAPEGIIAIDTGESVQEMQEALRELRAHTGQPVVAVLYTHFHYVNGTQAVVEASEAESVPIYGHERIPMNRSRAGAEIAPTYGRGLVEQFAVLLPPDGPDGVVNVGLGHFYRNPTHAPFSPGYLPPTHGFSTAHTIMVAGMEVEVTPAPSDADDSVTYWFPSIGVAVNNLVWPTLFNVFAIRGEEYRDPQVMLAGLDHLLSLGASYLVGTHGPPISGAESILARVTRYRDSIQFLWDQTVRLTNKGFTSTELAQAIRLPDGYDEDHLTSERYGVAEHHVRQIRTGLFGFFDGDEANLFPLATAERAGRLIEGFGGRDEVRRQVEQALVASDLRWALELGSWLVRSDAAELPDQLLLAEALRRVGQRSSAANIRSWCLTRARHLEGTVNMDRLYTHRFRRAQTLAGPIAASVHALRVVLDPLAAEGLDVHLGWRFSSGETAGLHVRNGIACPTEGANATIWMECSAETWADLLAGSTALSEAIGDGSLLVEGDALALSVTLACFEVEGLRT